MDKTSLDAAVSASIQDGPTTSAGRFASTSERAVGPLFKELYAGLIDVEDPDAFGAILADQTRPLLAHTTDIQTLAQFHSLHQVPRKSGTAYNHKTYLNTVEQLKA